jgi:hypothetical protein
MNTNRRIVMLVSDVRIGDTVDFQLHTNSALPLKYLGVKVLAVLDLGTARLFSPVESYHTSIYPTLPEGTPNDANDYLYFKLQQMNGEVVCIGQPWVREETLAVAGRSTLQVTIDNVTVEDIPKVVEALSSNGYTVSETKTV